MNLIGRRTYSRDDDSAPSLAPMKLWSIQVLRFVAALLVVFNHAGNVAARFTGQPIMGGWAALASGRLGVEIFFVISGYIIAATSKGLTIPAFVARRARRILPLWITARPSGACLLRGATGGTNWRALLATATFWPATDVMTGPVVPVGWTLCFEVLFYAGFAMTIWRRTMVLPIAALFGAALMIRGNPVFQFLGNPLIPLFAAGVVLALLPKWKPLALALPVGVVLMVWRLFSEAHGAAPVCDQPSLLAGTMPCLRTAGFGLPAFLVVAGVLQLEARKSPLTYLGDASYALYLTHYTVTAVIGALVGNLFHAPGWVIFTAACVAAILASCAAYEWVEKPLMARWKLSPRAVTAPV